MELGSLIRCVYLFSPINHISSNLFVSRYPVGDTDADEVSGLGLIN